MPQTLYLQLDNFARGNTNQYVITILSILTSHKDFQEAYVGTMLVGHTRKGIDGYFSFVSKQLKTNNAFIMANVMKTSMDSEYVSYMPELIQEVAHFQFVQYMIS